MELKPGDDIVPALLPNEGEPATGKDPAPNKGGAPATEGCSPSRAARRAA